MNQIHRLSEEVKATLTRAQISFTIYLHPWVSLAQYKALQQVISDGLQRYGFLVESYTANDIPPTTVEFPTHVVFQGVDPSVAQEQILVALQNALSTLPGYVSVVVEPPQ